MVSHQALHVGKVMLWCCQVRRLFFEEAEHRLSRAFRGLIYEEKAEPGATPQTATRGNFDDVQEVLSREGLI